MKPVEIVAHRGYSSIAPENTLLAFAKAMQAQVDMIELDVHMTSDRKLVVIHDETVDRTTDGTGLIKDLPLSRIKEYRIRDHEHSLFEERVPTLAEVLTCLQNDHRIKLNIEIKTDKVDYPGIEQLIHQEVKRYGFHNRVVYSSFNFQSLKRIKAFDSAASIALLFHIDDLPTKPWEYALAYGADAIHPHYRTVRRDWLEVCQQNHIQVKPYTVNDSAAMKQLMAWGIDGIITEYPDRLRQILFGQ